MNATASCVYCGVLPEYGHLDWCKITRAPFDEEIINAVLEEAERSVGDEGPSVAIINMCLAWLRENKT